MTLCVGGQNGIAGVWKLELTGNGAALDLTNPCRLPDYGRHRASTVLLGCFLQFLLFLISYVYKWFVFEYLYVSYA